MRATPMLMIAVVAGLLPAAACNRHDPKALERARAIFQDSRGAGVTLSSDAKSGTWIVRQVWKGSPAERAGIRRGDRVRAVNGVNLPPGKFEVPCGGSELLPMNIGDLRRRVQSAASGDVVRFSLERDGTPMDIAPPSGPLAPLYLDAGGDIGTQGSGDLICMDCDQKTCPGALNNNGYWTCEIEKCDDVTIVRCANPCMTS